MSESTSILVIKDTIVISESSQYLSVPSPVYLKEDFFFCFKRTKHKFYRELLN